MSALPPVTPPDPAAETTVTTGTGATVPLAPSKGPILQTLELSDGRHVAVGDVEPWYKSITYLGTFLPSLVSGAWAGFDLVEPVVTAAIRDFAAGVKVDWKTVGIKAGFSLYTGILAWRRKSRNSMLR